MALQVLPAEQSAFYDEDVGGLLSVVEGEVGRLVEEDIPEGYLDKEDEKAIKGGCKWWW